MYSQGAELNWSHGLSDVDDASEQTTCPVVVKGIERNINMDVL